MKEYERTQIEKEDEDLDEETFGYFAHKLASQRERATTSSSHRQQAQADDSDEKSEKATRTIVS